MSIDIDRLVLEIAERFTEHGMKSHLAELRRYYRARNQRKLERARSKHPQWDEDMLLKWAALWRIPPFESVYPQLPRPHCPCPRASESNRFTEATFPEGTLMRCLACDATWLVLTKRDG